MLVSSATLCLCARGKRVGVGEREREAVLAMLPSFLITSVSWCCPFLLPFHPLVLSSCSITSLFFPPGLCTARTPPPPKTSLLLCITIFFLSKTAHLLLYASPASSPLHATFSLPHSSFPLSPQDSPATSPPLPPLLNSPHPTLLLSHGVGCFDHSFLASVSCLPLSHPFIPSSPLCCHQYRSHLRIPSLSFSVSLCLSLRSYSLCISLPPLPTNSLTLSFCWLIFCLMAFLASFLSLLTFFSHLPFLSPLPLPTVP